MAFLKTIFALARISSLPTVWSNCLAGWWLGGGRHLDGLPFIFAGATFLYMGGSFLKDAFDADFDRQHRPERPIPAGTWSQNVVYRVGLTLLTIGALVLVWPGHITTALGLLLVFVIVVHNTTHRLMPVAPVLRAACRVLLYLLGASVAARGIGGWVIWCGLALALYATGMGYLGGSRLDATPPRRWPALLLAGPIVLGLLMNAGEYRESGLLLSAVVGLWSLRALRHLLWSRPPEPDRSIAALTAGVVFVDWLATCPLHLAGSIDFGGRQLSFAFLALFGLTVLLQQFELRSRKRSRA